MNNEVKHTPIPWTHEIEKVSGPKLESVYLFAHGDVIGEAYSDAKHEESGNFNCNENAALLVKAVNNHQRLIDALTFCKRVLGHLPSTQQSSTKTREAYDMAVALLVELEAA